MVICLLFFGDFGGGGIVDVVKGVKLIVVVFVNGSYVFKLVVMIDCDGFILKEVI